ncbi:hypothetical protein K1T71_011760 [Dendrolimus kikuchii]|uniref:Uncharacterized protein n=1 Tax=Dendrolimus kikuchii TaxID=765133 RepID=A0ACC1CM18_9NEOP|nr:hypothetical protein K1T71_011760 [Dendrolimus kikuchii]
MESPRKFNDCYFYYYSTCTKGDNCIFRHEPSALGCETMCTAWQQGKCMDKRCKLRHMELRKNRKQIPCYWENQPGGCRKMHCPFMHKNPDARTDGIAPSQPAPPTIPQGGMNIPDTGVSGEPPMPGNVTGVGAPAPPVPTPVPTPVPLLWQQQRQVVLDSAILGVQLSTTSDLRRVLTPHGHAHAHPHAHPHEPAPNPYAPLPVDPLVVNFEEESDNESAPSSTPTKNDAPDEVTRIARTKSQELLLLEKIQAESAAFYSYDSIPHADLTKDRKIVRPNLSTKYDRMTLDEISGKKQVPTERRSSLDFKILSLEEIRARKKDTIIHSTPITLNLSRKRKLSTHETLTTSGNKIIKVVRSNSIVYKKLDKSAPIVSSQSKMDHKQIENINRKRTLSEQSDIYEVQENELDDNCYEFKRIKITEQTSKPRLIRNRQKDNSISEELKVGEEYNKDNDSDAEVQVVSVEMSEEHVDLSKLSDSEIIDVESTNLGEPIDIVDLSEDQEGDVIISDIDIDLSTNVPDVVASCQKSTSNKDTIKILESGNNLLNDIDALLNEHL